MKFSTPGGIRTWLSLAQILAGSAILIAGVWQRSLLGIGLGVWTLALSYGLWSLEEWARRLVVMTWLGVLIYGTLTATSWTAFPWLAGLVPTAWAFWHYFAPAHVALRKASQSLESPAGEQPPMTSLVLLLRNPRPMSARLLVQYVQDAWGGQYHCDDTMPGDDSHITGRFVVGSKPSFLVSSPDGMFLVNVFDQPYFDDPDALADEVGDLRLRHTLGENKAWISVDLMMPPRDEVERLKAYGPIAKLTAELSGADCLALFGPETNRWLPWSNELEEKLKTGDALRLLESEAVSPVVEVPPDDPRMQAAVAEAKQRWPEFQEAFNRRITGDSEHYGIKVPITEGQNTEFIWIEVHSIQGNTIHGHLANEPVELGNLRIGSAVHVRADQVMDWAYTRNGEPTGLFGVKALQRIQEDRISSKQSPEPGAQAL